MAANRRTADADSLRGSLLLVARGWWIILLCAGAAVGASIAYSDRESTSYTAQTKLVLAGNGGEQVITGGYNPVDAGRRLQTASDVISLPIIAEGVARRVGAETAAGASIEPVVTTNSDIMAIEATAPGPQAAAAVANATAREFIRYQQMLRSRALSATRTVLQQQTRAATNRADRRALVAKRNNLAALQSLQNDEFSVAQPATAPAQASNTPVQRTAAIALVLGGLVGVGLALMRAPRGSRRA